MIESILERCGFTVLIDVDEYSTIDYNVLVKGTLEASFTMSHCGRLLSVKDCRSQKIIDHYSFGDNGLSDFLRNLYDPDRASFPPGAVGLRTPALGVDIYEINSILR